MSTPPEPIPDCWSNMTDAGMNRLAELQDELEDRAAAKVSELRKGDTIVIHSVQRFFP